MAIDIRADVTCSLGPLISGSLSDSYIQGNGLVFIRGSCELKGLYTPALGTAVTFSYTRSSVTTAVPRKLRVLSSFADPFRNITKVELGCKLTYLESLAPAPTLDGLSSKTSGAQQQCELGGSSYANGLTPIYASVLMDTCLTKLGITASSNPLTNVFYEDEFDFSPGYVQVLGDLLVSESFFGFLDEDEVLQVRDLSLEGGTGKVIDTSTLIDIDGINVGDLPAEAVVVRYHTTKFKSSTVPTSGTESNVEVSETSGDPEDHYLRYTNSSGEVVTQKYSYVPYSKTITEYPEKPPAFNCETLALYEKLKNSPLRRTTYTRVFAAQVAGSFCSEVLTAGLPFGTVGPSLESEYVNETVYIYDENEGELIRTVETTYQPHFMWACSLGIKFVYFNATTGVPEQVNLLTNLVKVEEVVTEFKNYYKQPPLLDLRYQDRVLSNQVVTTTTYRNLALCQQGQQNAAAIRETAPFETREECQYWLEYWEYSFYLDNRTVQNNQVRSIASAQKRVTEGQSSSGTSTTNVQRDSKLAYALGSSAAQRIVVYSMPYQSDDYYSSGGGLVKGDAEAKAVRYGRCQNRLLLGNRSGANLQLHPNQLPKYPFDVLYLTAGGLTVLYRANGINWTFSSDGVVGSVDALYWGVAGGTGTSWVPVAPGVTTFPAAPVITSGSATTTTLVQPWIETVEYAGVSRTVLEIRAFNYITGNTTTALTLTSRVFAEWFTLLTGAPGALTLSGQGALFTYNRAVTGGAGTYTATGQSAGYVRDLTIGANVGSYTLVGRDVQLVYDRLPFAVDAGSYELSGQDVSWFKGVEMALEAGTFSASGQSADVLITERILSASPGNLSATGQSATLTYLASEVRILTYTGNGTTTNAITGLGFKPGMLWLKRRTTTTDDWSIHASATQSLASSNYYSLSFQAATVNSASSYVTFDSDGFTLTTSTVSNTNTGSYLAYAFKEGGAVSDNTSGTITSQVSVNSALEYSTFRYTGNGSSGATIGHGLSGTPDLVITGFNTTFGYAGSPLIGANYYIRTSNTSPRSSNTTFIQTIGASTFSLGTSTGLNGSGTVYHGMAFKSKAGTSKIGTFAGNGSATQSITGLGFKPRLVIVRAYITEFSNWVVFEDGRDARMFLNTTGNETATDYFTSDSDGFTVESGAGVNTSGGTYLYLAFF